ncbi:MAG TPA: hypothetical protein VLB83_03150 [Candidatus Paceibacterota bacterium]|nr:hypothetical protein [Candidatus Paceibacterota bacterium]
MMHAFSNCLGSIRTADLAYQDTWTRIFDAAVNFSTVSWALGAAFAYAAWRTFRASRRRATRPTVRFALKCAALLWLAVSAMLFALPFVTVASDPKC